MKITVLGRGNAGCLTALHYHHFSQFLKDQKVEVELIHDSNTPPIKVGQATTLDMPNLLWSALGTQYYNNSKDLNYTLKSGILYKDWGDVKEVFHEFPMGNYAVHYDTTTFQNHILKNCEFDVKVVDKYVEDYSKIDSDYIFDCRGWPKSQDDYEELINPLNSVIVARLPNTEKDPGWTEAVATKNGWCFYIPLEDFISVGYLYNSDITKKEDALSDFQSMYNFDKVFDSFSFKNYVCKEPIIDDRIALNGNRLFFLEPLESTAVATYLKWARYTWDWIFNGVPTYQAKANIRQYINQVEKFILWHYGFGSKYKTPFWDYAKDLTYKNLTDEGFKNIVKEVSTKKASFVRGDQEEYAQWKKWNFKCWLDGMNGK